MIRAILEKAGSVDLAADGLVLVFEPALKSQARLLQRRESLALLEKEATRLAGRPVSIRIEFDEPGARSSAARDASPAAPPPGPAKRASGPAKPAPRPAAGPADSEAKKPGNRGDDRDSLMRRASNEPGVKRLLREFGAQVVDIRADEARPKRGPMEEP